MYQQTWCKNLGTMMQRNRAALRRLPLSHPRRIMERDKKLIEREIARAEAADPPETRIPCPCRECKRGIRSKQCFKTVRKHIRIDGYGEWLRGSSEGYDPDESDQEWDEFISREFGEVVPSW